MLRSFTIERWKPSDETWSAYRQRLTDLFEINLDVDVECHNKLLIDVRSGALPIPEDEYERAWLRYLRESRRSFQVCLLVSNKAVIASQGLTIEEIWMEDEPMPQIKIEFLHLRVATKG